MAMARNPLKARIINLVDDPKHAGRKIITVEFDDGNSDGPWRQSFSLLFNRPISLEEFAEYIRERHLDETDSQVVIARPKSTYEYLENAKGDEFNINLSKPPEVPDGSKPDA